MSGSCEKAAFYFKCGPKKNRTYFGVKLRKSRNRCEARVMDGFCHDEGQQPLVVKGDVIIQVGSNPLHLSQYSVWDIAQMFMMDAGMNLTSKKERRSSLVEAERGKKTLELTVLRTVKLEKKSGEFGIHAYEDGFIASVSNSRFKKLIPVGSRVVSAQRIDNETGFATGSRETIHSAAMNLMQTSDHVDLTISFQVPPSQLLAMSWLENIQKINNSFGFEFGSFQQRDSFGFGVAEAATACAWQVVNDELRVTRQMLPGDIICSIDGMSLSTNSHEEIIRKLKVAKGAEFLLARRFTTKTILGSIRGKSSEKLLKQSAADVLLHKAIASLDEVDAEETEDLDFDLDLFEVAVEAAHFQEHHPAEAEQQQQQFADEDFGFDFGDELDDDEEFGF